MAAVGVKPSFWSRNMREQRSSYPNLSCINDSLDHKIASNLVTVIAIIEFKSAMRNTTAVIVAEIIHR